MECKTQNEIHHYLLVHCDRQVQIAVVAKTNCELLEYRHNLIGSDLKNILQQLMTLSPTENKTHLWFQHRGQWQILENFSKYFQVQHHRLLYLEGLRGVLVFHRHYLSPAEHKTFPGNLHYPQLYPKINSFSWSVECNFLLQLW